MSDKIPPAIASQHGTAPIRVIVVGAGGTGGRLIPPLMQILRRGDSVAVIDGDHVEDRNLARQNFRVRDVGENKAEVMARRYRRDGIDIHAHASMLTDASWAEVSRLANNERRTVIMGCVDNASARALMKKCCNLRDSTIWIDGGNETRGGQVLLTARAWPFMVKHLDKSNTINAYIRGINAMPQLLIPAPWHCGRCDVHNEGGQLCSRCGQTEESCRDRIDLQTVAVNNLSATAMLNILSAVMYGLPISACGAFFSTLNTMKPILLDSVKWETNEIFPETTFAA